ncbi:MAG TPA: hypothetical protein VMT55_05610 [Candidatus Sulfotelmatobacter sp.]|nr:hypothetical protein [Candidatus Sulfotelmatobacter sp.]
MSGLEGSGATLQIYMPHRSASWLGTLANRVIPTRERQVPKVISGFTMGAGKPTELFVMDGFLWVNCGSSIRCVPDSKTHAERLAKTGSSPIPLAANLTPDQVRLRLNALMDNPPETAAAKLARLGIKVDIRFVESATDRLIDRTPPAGTGKGLEIV